MTPLQEAFLNELKSKPKLSAVAYAALYTKHSQLAVEYEENIKGVSKQQAKAMGNYYTVSVLADFINNENLLNRILHLCENTPTAK